MLCFSCGFSSVWYFLFSQLSRLLYIFEVCLRLACCTVKLFFVLSKYVFVHQIQYFFYHPLVFSCSVCGISVCLMMIFLTFAFATLCLVNEMRKESYVLQCTTIQVEEKYVYDTSQLRIEQFYLQITYYWYFLFVFVCFRF